MKAAKRCSDASVSERSASSITYVTHLQPNQFVQDVIEYACH